MEYLIHLAILSSIYAILGLGLNLVIGYTGLLSIAHAAFYGIGAYVVAILGTSYGMNFFVALILGMILSAIVALAVGIILSKFSGDFYALASLGFGVIVYSTFLNWQGLTRGPLGIPGIDRPNLFGFSFDSNISFLVLALVFATVSFYGCRLLVNSSFGRVIKAIREDEEAISVFGYNTLYFKLVVFVIGAILAAVAGALFAAYITFIDPSTFNINESIFILAIVILGGLSSNRGAVVGAIFLILLPELLRFVGFPSGIAAQMRQLTYGAILVLLMLYRPQGLLGEFRL